MCVWYEQIRFHFSFQDHGYLYMCMDLAPGGILSDIINAELDKNAANGIPDKACDLSTAQFYTAEIVSALQYLHGLGIVHRDLKPESE